MQVPQVPACTLAGFPQVPARAYRGDPKRPRMKEPRLSLRARGVLLCPVTYRKTSPAVAGTRTAAVPSWCRVVVQRMPFCARWVTSTCRHSRFIVSALPCPQGREGLSRSTHMRQAEFSTLIQSVRGFKTYSSRVFLVTTASRIGTAVSGWLVRPGTGKRIEGYPVAPPHEPTEAAPERYTQ